VQWLWIQCTAQLFTSSHNKKHNDFMQKIQTIYLNQNKNTKHTNKVSKHIHHLNKCDRASSCSSLHKTVVMGTTHAVMRTACSKQCGNKDNTCSNEDSMQQTVWEWGQGYTVQGSHGVKHLTPCYSLIWTKFDPYWEAPTNTVFPANKTANTEK